MPVVLVVNNPVDCGHGDTIAPLAWHHLEEALQLHVMFLMSASDGFGGQTHCAWVEAAVVQDSTVSRRISSMLFTRRRFARSSFQTKGRALTL